MGRDRQCFGYTPLIVPMLQGYAVMFEIFHRKENHVRIHILLWLEDLKIIFRRHLYHLCNMGESVRITIVYQFIYCYMGVEAENVHGYISSMSKRFSVFY